MQVFFANLTIIFKGKLSPLPFLFLIGSLYLPQSEKVTPLSTWGSSLFLDRLIDE